MPDADTRDKLKRNGWRQGAAINRESIESLIDSCIIPIEWQPGDIAIVVSQDCDVLNECESKVEFIRASLINPDDIQRNNLYGRSPRQLFVSLGGQSFQLDIIARFWISREALASLAPDVMLGKKEVSKLSTWMSLRYNRAALPDVFNERIRSAESWLSKRLGRLHPEEAEHLLGLYIIVGTEEDLPLGEEYDISLLVLLASETPPDLFDSLKGIFDNFVDRISATGTRVQPEIEDGYLQRADSVTVADIRSMTRWAFDDLSVRTKETPSETLRTLD